MKHPRISTYLSCSFVGLLALLIVVTTTSITEMGEVGRLAGQLNGSIVAKTRIADDLVDLGQQLRFVDAFLVQSVNAEQDALVESMIKDRIKAVDAKTAAFMPYVASDMERSLLRNIERSRRAYLDLQARILARPPAQRSQDATAEETQLAASFDNANRMARGLAHFAEADARSAREEAADIVDSDRIRVIFVSGLAVAIGLLIMLFLKSRIFRPLKTLTSTLLRLAQGRHDIAIAPSGRGDEIDDIANALDVFRQNAVALGEAHRETQAAHLLADSLARHDPLTGLPNRRVLGDNLGAAIARSRRGASACALLVVDLDRFKPVNDIHGHAAGDRVLCEVAARLGAILRTGETASRLGGDEFAIVLEFAADNDAPARVAKRIIASLSTPITIDGTVVNIGASIGIAVWPTDGEEAERLLHAADLAMLKAKRDERGSFRFFEPDMDLQLRARANLEARIRAAIAQGDIRPHYQPLLDLKRDEILGFEILARWHDADRLIPPNDFIPIAEEAGLIPDLTYSVLRQACRDARAWPNTLTLALNVTPAQISDVRLPDILLDILADETFPPERLELEITENALIGDVTKAKSVIAQLRRHGIRMSLDDFGTGYSSLQHLREFKFDKIKIDRSFVQSMFDSKDSSTIIETIIGLGKNLGMNTIAEGIENAEHLKRLVAYGCEYGQGYHLGRPLDALSAGRMLLSRGFEMRSSGHEVDHAMAGEQPERRLVA